MLALAVSMYDEVECMGKNLAYWGSEFEKIAIVQSGLEPYKEIGRLAMDHPACSYTQFENLDKRTDQSDTAERFDIGARAMSRNFSYAFKEIGGLDQEIGALRFIVGITGDTQFIHLNGIRRIIEQMGDADIAVSRAMGQSFHRASLTIEQMRGDENLKRGRVQDESTGDFMPQLFIARASLLDSLSHIVVTNRWCFEQCLGDAVLRAKRYVFSRTAYGFSDGIRYHYPSPKGWKHVKCLIQNDKD
ncbi:MAG: hypothetical protein KKH70_20650 [Gammaproteobacteria bacterium]|nr:hypothetical protein [Gammaproteobacteria bacterium]